MLIRTQRILVFLVVSFAASGPIAAAEDHPGANYTKPRPTPGLDFPTPAKKLLGYRDAQKRARIRQHAWGLFDALTQTVGSRAKCGSAKAGDRTAAPQGPQDQDPCELAVWETWYTKCNALPTSCPAAQEARSPTGHGKQEPFVKRQFEIPLEPFLPLLSRVSQAADLKAMAPQDQGYDQMFLQILTSAGVTRVLFEQRGLSSYH